MKRAIYQNGIWLESYCFKLVKDKFRISGLMNRFRNSWVNVAEIFSENIFYAGDEQEIASSEVPNNPIIKI